MTDDTPAAPIDDATWRACLHVLEQAIQRPGSVPDQEALERLAARLYKRARRQRRKTEAEERREHDREVVEEVLSAREEQRVFENRETRDQGGRTGGEGRGAGGDAHESGAKADTVPLLADARRCYVCRGLYRDLHVRYHLLCPACAAFQEQKREERADLSGRRALVTGARLKIGHATALRLLRWGAEVIATSRFAEAAQHAFEAAPDFADLRGRLHVVGADFRDPREGERLAARVIERFGSLDILVNNAARTVDRPEDEQLAAGEVAPAEEDRRELNGWTMRIEDVSADELLTVLHVNAAAPFLLTSRLLPALRASRFPDRYVVNVVGLDGQFDRPLKSALHPHVNMSKAALNMLTRTSAQELVRQGIFMSSVDVGWVTHEGGWSSRQRARAEGFLPPLDAEDAAARICDPIARGLGGARDFGRLWKDFHEGAW